MERLENGIIKGPNIVIGEGIPKICVPITAKKEKDIINDAGLIAKSRADLIEWRVDCFDGCSEKSRILYVLAGIKEYLPDKPLIFTFRTQAEGGYRQFSSNDYCKLVELAADSIETDIVDIELNTKKMMAEPLIKMAHEKGKIVIASNHDFQQTPGDEIIAKRLEKMDEIGADILKVAYMPQTNLDVLRLMNITAKIKEKINDKILVSMSMGGCGVISRLSGEITGSAITFASVTGTSAPGQTSIEEAISVMKLVHDKII
ncbi:3-dehydroquinate dehydratase [Acetitomaculum ruminis DSM 5522]|uniref:3-dehydroquinate dehydratase n=1 Tax=Acetitomaculum ruminis DSM 5522 TaxID=1120918 RepID=A0A1I0XPR2_9FIRM|nr:type I 3-dehydroquinate dehydratase [Acetitomaculum ruminis]SFB01953.1 3-dehydroquinate dehydratase [Acetitomaculum ruminis DSM 5522]